MPSNSSALYLTLSRSAYGTIRVSLGKGFSRASSKGLYCFQPKVSTACLTCRQTICVSLCTRRTSWRSSLPKLHLSLKARSSVGRFPYRWVFSCQCAPRGNIPHSIPVKSGRWIKTPSLHSRKNGWVRTLIFNFFWEIFEKCSHYPTEKTAGWTKSPLTPLPKDWLVDNPSTSMAKIWRGANHHIQF